MNTSPAMGSGEVHTRKLNDGQGSNIGETRETSGQKIGAEVMKTVIVETTRNFKIHKFFNF